MSTKNNQINVVICDDHQVVLEGLRLIFNQSENIHITGIFHDGATMISFLETAATRPDVIVVDAHLGKNENGLDLINKVKDKSLYRWILFSSYVDKYLVFQAEKYGFQACLSKEVPASVMLSIIHEVEPRSFICYPAISRDENSRKKIESILEAKKGLTKRELEVMSMILTGENSKECADKLHISIYTFETHKKNIFRKFDINSTNELMRIAMDFNFN